MTQSNLTQWLGGILARYNPKTALTTAATCCALVLGGCSSLPEKKIYTNIDINAPAEQVWAILVDNSAYAEWNPYHVRVNGTIAVGNTLDLQIHKPNGDSVLIQPSVMRLEPLRELTWGGGIRGIFFGEHVFLLEPINAQQTRLIHKEHFSGIAIPFASLETIEEGYADMNTALKQRAEAGH
ncbi:MAG: SRPBCC domain-containing protein [Pseudomonadota bacterium]|nr:SRPBCC domain-containing protein [Pseudomonadota bacterium]